MNQKDFAALRRCRPCTCDVKLGQSLFPRLRAIDWSAGAPASRYIRDTRPCSAASGIAARRKR
ncbi:MAG: hypothetical protein AB7H96_00945 [Vicinamibacterales bacterium]